MISCRHEQALGLPSVVGGRSSRRRGLGGGLVCHSLSMLSKYSMSEENSCTEKGRGKEGVGEGGREGGREWGKEGGREGEKEGGRDGGREGGCVEYGAWLHDNKHISHYSYSSINPHTHPHPHTHTPTHTHTHVHTLHTQTPLSVHTHVHAYVITHVHHKNPFNATCTGMNHSQLSHLPPCG